MGKIKVKVRPSSGKQEVVRDRDNYIANLKSAPENNKANVELVKLLQRFFNKKVRIKSGLKSKNKIVEVGE